MVGLAAVIYSLNRGVWLGIMICVVYAVGAFLRRGRIAPLLAVAGVTMVAVVLIVASPLKQVIDTRAENGKSDSIRAFTTERALDLATASPLVGFGGTRSAVGSPSSIAIGKSPECKNCGNIPIGINGYLWTLLVTTGFGGTLLFFSFWASQLWHSRGDRSAVASAARLTVVVSVFFAFFYTLDPLLPSVALGLLWRGQKARRGRRGAPL
nr:O-antigen ligase family protein [Nocardioides daedukensis]